MANLKPEWARFAVGTPSLNPKFTEPSCRVLTTVFHVAHIDTALNIVRDGKIKPSLISDKSKLNRDRILVIWVSPNDWSGAGGSRYGNIEFAFDWRSLIAGKKYYWVEAIAYNTSTCRILVTDIDHSQEAHKLQEYDPTEGNGPWWHDTATDQHYWNGNYCLEVMLEREIPLMELVNTDFMKHHPKFCCNTPEICPDRDQHSEQGGARFLAGLAALQLNAQHLNLTQETEGLIQPTESTRRAWHQLRAELTRIKYDYRGTIDYDERIQSVAVARAILSAYWLRNQMEQEAMSELFATKDAMVNSCVRLIRRMLGVTYQDMADEQEDDFV